jgi:sulfide:quinone oxidoreductase
LSNFTSVYAAPGSVIFGVEPIKKTLMEVIDRYGIDFKPLFLIQRIDSTNKTAYFKFNGTADVWDILDISKEKGAQKLDDQVVSIPFDFMHLAPPQKAPEFLKTSGLTNDAGWVDVDINTLQHNDIIFLIDNYINDENHIYKNFRNYLPKSCKPIKTILI